MYQVDDAAAVGHGDGDRADDAAVLGFQGIQDLKVVAVLLIALGDAESHGHIGGFQIFPCPLCAHGQAVLGGAEDDAGLNGPDGGQRLAHKVKEAGAVQHVYFAAAVIHGSHCGGNGDLAFGLLGVIVADGVAVADLTHTVDGAGAEQHALGKAGLAGVAMAQQADVADVLGFVTHVLLPLCALVCVCLYALVNAYENHFHIQFIIHYCQGLGNKNLSTCPAMSQKKAGDPGDGYV